MRIKPLLVFYFRVEEKFAGGKFREIPFGVDIIFAGGKFRAKSKFAKIAKIYSTRKNGVISTTNLAACVCVSSKFDQFLPARFYFVSKRPETVVRIAKFPYAAFGPLFAFHCPLFVTKNNNLGWNRHASPHTGTCRCNDHGPTVLSARGQ